jgi:sulfatase modifying factor 1
MKRFIALACCFGALGALVRAATISENGPEYGPFPPEKGFFFAGTMLKPTETPEALDPGTTCPDDMLEVEGDFCPFVEQRCLRWLDPRAAIRLQCAEFAPTKKCGLKTKPRHFCIDRYEWPNKPGSTPVVAIDWYKAKDSCQSLGKRLCLDSEWTVACEGQERLPYPYGFARNPEACNIDKVWRNVDFGAYANTRTRAAEVARLDQRVPSGSRPACVSPFGVHDMTGNVDEWVVNESGKPFKSGLKGGYWGPVRTRCRPMTTSHEEKFSFYQVGFRCCADVPPEKPAARATRGAPPKDFTARWGGL